MEMFEVPSGSKAGAGRSSSQFRPLRAFDEPALTDTTNPKFANEHDIGVACMKAKGCPALASRDFLDRFVTAYNIK